MSDSPTRRLAGMGAVCSPLDLAPLGSGDISARVPGCQHSNARITRPIAAKPAPRYLRVAVINSLDVLEDVSHYDLGLFVCVHRLAVSTWDLGTNYMRVFSCSASLTLPHISDQHLRSYRRRVIQIARRVIQTNENCPAIGGQLIALFGVERNL